MRSAQQIGTALLAFGAAACAPDRITTRDRGLVSVEAHAWSGGALLLRSERFQPGEPLPVVLSGWDTLPVRPHGANAVLVAVPDTVGRLALDIALPQAGFRQTAVVHVHGFERGFQGPRAEGYLLPWPAARTLPTALAYQYRRLVLIDFRFNTSRIVAPDTGLDYLCMNGPMPSAVHPSLVVISAGPGCGPVVAVPISPATLPRDSAGTSWDAVAHLAPRLWIFPTGNHQLTLWWKGERPPGATYASWPCEHPSRYAVSPRGDRVVPIGCGASSGIPIFAPTAPYFAYYLQGPRYGVSDVVFSETGDTLWAVGPGEVIAADAATGRILARVGLRSSDYGAGIVLDPVVPRFYVAEYVPGDGPVVEVFDRETMTLLATLRVPAPALHGTYVGRFTDFFPFLDAAARKLYVALGDPFVLVFDLMP